MEPFEIIAAPFTAWWAPPGTAFPLVDAEPAVDWTKIGTSGDRNYSDEGVTVSHAQTIQVFRSLGSTGPVKASRTEESLMVRFALWDMTLEQVALALNSGTVTETAAGAGTAGFKELPLYRGQSIAAMALLLRGVSAYGDAFAAQYEVPLCFVSSSPEPVFSKGAPAGIALEFTALEDPDAATEAARFGRLVSQHEAAT